MGQVLHGSATTTEAIRRAIQHSQESLRALARRHGINPKTVAKWRKRCSVADLRTGPRVPRSPVRLIVFELVSESLSERHTVCGTIALLIQLFPPCGFFPVCYGAPAMNIKEARNSLLAYGRGERHYARVGGFGK